MKYILMTPEGHKTFGPGALYQHDTILKTVLGNEIACLTLDRTQADRFDLEVALRLARISGYIPIAVED